MNTDKATQHNTQPTLHTETFNPQLPGEIQLDYIENLFNQEGAFGEADCAGL